MIMPTLNRPYINPKAASKPFKGTGGLPLKGALVSALKYGKAHCGMETDEDEMDEESLTRPREMLSRGALKNCLYIYIYILYIHVCLYLYLYISMYIHIYVYVSWSQSPNKPWYHLPQIDLKLLLVVL